MSGGSTINQPSTRNNEFIFCPATCKVSILCKIKIRNKKLNPILQSHQISCDITKIKILF
jgi:hypothetical protein